MESKKLILLLFMGILLVGTVSAFNFDNVKSYDKLTRTATIKDCAVWAITCLVEGDDIAEVKLDSPLIKYVIRGKDRLIAEFTINNYEDYDNVFNNLDFYDIKNNMKEFERDFTYRYKSFYDVEVPDYETVCKERMSINGTLEKYDCYESQTGTHTEQRFNWVDFNEKAELPKGNITIGIFTDVLPNEKVEWIPTLFGVKISEWATWTEGLSVDLEAYYDFNDNSTNLIDVVTGVYNVTLQSTNWTEGILGSGYGVTGVDTGNTTMDMEGATAYSNSFWMMYKGDGVGGVRLWMTNNNVETDSDNGKVAIRSPSNREILWMTVDGVSRDFTVGSPGIFPNDKWIMFTFVINSTSANMYINGTLVDTVARSGFVGNTAAFGLFGAQDSGWKMQQIYVDEVGFWSRDLSVSEISDLYNDGVGITYGQTAFPEVTTQLISPEDNLDTTNTSLQFDSSASIVSANITNATLYVWNPDHSLFGTNFTSNVSGISNSTNLSISSLAINNSYKWNVEWCGNDSAGVYNCSFAPSNFSFDIKLFAENSQTYNETSIETAIEGFTANVTYDSSTYSVITGRLFYNNTWYTGTKTGVGNEAIFKTTITTPSISTSPISAISRISALSAFKTAMLEFRMIFQTTLLRCVSASSKKKKQQTRLIILMPASIPQLSNSCTPRFRA